MIGRVNTGGGGSPNKSTIIVTAPTGSTVTCKMGSITKTAPEKNGVWTFGGLDLGTWTITSTKGSDTATQDVAITRLTVEYVTLAYRMTPEFTYTGDYAIVDDSDNPISDFANWKSNWKIRFLTSGTFTVTKLNGWDGQLDVFLVGGGAGGRSSDSANAQGGGGGYTKTTKSIQIQPGTSYSIVVGSGGSANNDGGKTSAFGESVNGGSGKNGGSGGGGGGHNNNGGNGGSDGSDGNAGGNTPGGTGQGTTTREFGETGKRPYSGGGGGGCYNFDQSDAHGGSGGSDGGGNGGTSRNETQTAGTVNTGGGGGGGKTGKNGGSGIVIVRNYRGEAA